MKNSIYFRIFIATALIVLISFSLLGGLFSVWSYRQSMMEKSARMSSALQATARYVSSQHLYYGIELSDLNLSMYLAMIAEVSGFDSLITDANGVIESCSERDFVHFGKLVPESLLRSINIDAGIPMLTTLGNIYPEQRQVMGIPLATRINGMQYVFGYLFVTSDLESFKQEWRNFSSLFVLIALNVMVLAFIISFVATRKQAKPLNEMANAALRFARGDFSTRVGMQNRPDEIGQLTQAFNAMADSLEGSEQLRRDFINNISHELKTPMTVIAGFAEGLLDGTIPHEDEARYLGIISLETRRLSRLVKSMTDMSTIQSMDKETVLNGSFDISEVVKLALLSLDSKLENRELDVRAELPEEAVMTRGDMDSVTQVVYNLIDNAVKFSVPGGLIVLGLWKQGTKAYVSVENHGDTIPADELPYIFERFHKADKSRSADRDGIGLGLYIVKTILDNHNEDIFVTSANGVTKFIFSLTVI